MSGYWIDVPGVKSSAKSFTDLSDRMQQVFQKLKSGLAAEGECQGHDQYGEAFDKNYQEPKENALEFFPQMVDGIRDMGAGLIEMADTTARGEDTNDKKFLT
ncbi:MULTISPECIES: hypothetical protein [Dactylosporangium]|uniref:WXG100 family type VII secretion target n=2 Tax=Dactylosporangium TaxID=35753 RepID=A0A9W6NL98_9ACTN|nr:MULTISPECIES: hypothetical protein [Dactylosporangium]UAB92730.1 hypothetical protein Dvina_30920 [Dactylosporangium vinaceum]UWZ41162.1 hypothetical protein Dmats_26005 [Dactylosporangium matsuzakiense]GLL00926.1 hypothetical protein GCM10017581_026670 [Dactylosporangium matsuzakiense]